MQLKDFRAIELSLLCRIYAIRSCFLSFLALLEVVLCWLRSPAFAFFGVSLFFYFVCFASHSLPRVDRDVWLAVVFSPLGGFLSPVFFFFWVERHSLLGWICALWFMVCSWYG